MFFFTVFLVEMLIKVTGLGYYEYFKDQFNSFDFSIVVISSVDVIMTLSNIDVLKGSNAV